MDQLLSQLIPTQRIGNDGFNWWVGQVEGTAKDEKNNKGGIRYKVRIVGEHPSSKELLDTPDLPWCSVMMPVNVPFMPGNEGGAGSQLEVGCWVVGFYLDQERQKPIIMGSIGHTPGATTIIKNARPNDPPFTRAISARINPAKDGKPAPENQTGGSGQTGTQTDSGTTFTNPTFSVDNTGLQFTGSPLAKTNQMGGGLADGSTDKDGNTRVPIPPSQQTENEEKWCQSVAEKCDKQDLGTEVKSILGELLAATQGSGGQLGDLLINKATGELYSVVGEARKYTNKMMFVIQHFIAKVKGYIITKMENAVKDLVNALIYPSETGNSLTPVTEFFNKMLKDLGCQMADLGDRLAEWLTNVLMDLVTQIYQAVACQIDTLVNGILSKINSLLEDLLSSVLGPLQDILGVVAEPLNIIGGAINYVLNLLGISCSGPDQTCATYKKVCTDGSKEEKDDEEENKKKEDFLDNLVSDIDNLFPSTGADYTSYTCADAYTGKPLEVTTIGFTGGVPLPVDPNENVSELPKIVYTISDVEVTEGEDAEFTVTRSGYTVIASSVKYETLNDQGTAESEIDYDKVNDILGFAPNETSKTFKIKTFINPEKEPQETFFVSLSLNSPANNSEVITEYNKNIGKCVIKESSELKKPYSPQSTNPSYNISKVFTPSVVGNPTDIDDLSGNNNAQGGATDTPFYSVTADKTSVKEGEFITYTVKTKNVPNGTVAYYTLTGVSASDIIGATLSGSFVISQGAAKIVVGIAEDDEPETTETLTLTINGTGANASVLIVPDANNKGSGSNIEDYDKGIGDVAKTSYVEFSLPTVDSKKVITDENGGIIEIPIDNPGSPWAEPPYVFVGGQGLGATAKALLDKNGYLTEIRVQSSGYGYKKNLAADNDVRCIIDSFTIIRPGIGYTETPELYVDGELGVAEAIINDDGYVIGGRVLDRTRTFDKFPEILIVGGGGYGAKLLPSLVCLEQQALTTIGATKVGTGRYVDCP